MFNDEGGRYRPLSIEEGTTLNVCKTFPCKPRPKYGRGCLAFTEFARAPPVRTPSERLGFGIQGGGLGVQGTGFRGRCPANMRHIRQSTPNSGSGKGSQPDSGPQNSEVDLPTLFPKVDL